ncbi:type VI secretion system-associated protein TagF [Tistrella mobilis]|uniref:type VI secretion system-associated protein TagF n=1 Tax=Tistrella mobilis TaxID=171437 RepID=UPI0031F66B03
MSAALLRSATPPGVCGKLPWLGDFVRRRLDDGFVEPWDGWVRAGLARVRDDLPDAWLALYLQAPVWRFVLPPGICGRQGAAGVLMASVDRVGRYYPLTIAARLDEMPPPPGLASAAADWFARVEDLALAALDPDVDPDRWERALLELEGPVMADHYARGAGQSLDGGVVAVRLDRPGDLGPAFAALAHRAEPQGTAGPVQFWTLPRRGEAGPLPGRFVFAPDLPEPRLWHEILRGGAP